MKSVEQQFKEEEMKKIFMILFIMLFCCVGCVSTYEQMVNNGYSQDYALGFSDGEQSGMASGGYVYSRFKKNTEKAQTNKEYGQGWEDGFKYGSNRMNAINNMSSRY